MNRRLVLLLVGVIYTFVALKISLQMLQGGFVSSLSTLLLVVPLVPIFLNKTRPYWLGLLIGSLTLSTLFKVPLLDRFQAALILIIAIGAIYIMELAMKKTMAVNRDHKIYKLMLAAAIFITIRFVWDRPGSARISETGGLGMAINFLAAGWAFLVAQWAVQFERNYRGQVWMMMCLGGLGLLTFIMRSIASERGFYIGILYHRQIWVIAAVVLAWTIAAPRIRRQIIPWFFICAMFVMGMSSFTDHRSRPLFALASVLAVGYVYRRFQRTLVSTFAAGALGIVALLAIGGGVLPEPVQRSLSIFVKESDEYLAKTGRYGEMGWDSEFRWMMWRNAWEHIRHNPVFGKGFAFNREEIIAGLQQSNRNAAIEDTLAMTGVYHNSFLALAVFCGLPAVFLFIISFLKLVFPFAKWARDQATGETKMLAAALLAMIWPFVGQALMNGAGVELLHLAILMGVMFGIWQRDLSERRAQGLGRIERPQEVAAGFTSSLRGKS